LTDEFSARLEEIATNVSAVRRRIDAACVAAGRTPSEVTLVAVTKTQSAETVRAAVAAGLTDFGENYVQEAVAKMDGVEDSVRWHFIGNLQSNKAHLVVGRASLIQSVDRPRIATALGRLAAERGIVQDVLIQVHLGTEETKSGCAPADLASLVDLVTSESGLRLRGLMGIAPLTELDGKISEPIRYFHHLRTLGDSLNSEYCDILSMGMSGDYEAAIAAGSTMVRVGSALFGVRPPKN
jgi:pyridoxal phosphate enzyme (YggS family)